MVTIAPASAIPQFAVGQYLTELAIASGLYRGSMAYSAAQMETPDMRHVVNTTFQHLPRVMSEEAARWIDSAREGSLGGQMENYHPRRISLDRRHFDLGPAIVTVGAIAYALHHAVPLDVAGILTGPIFLDRPSEEPHWYHASHLRRVLEVCGLRVKCLSG